MRSTKPELGDFELDLGRYELRRRGRPVKLEKRPMELLIFLVARREQLVTRRDIVTKLWLGPLCGCRGQPQQPHPKNQDSVRRQLREASFSGDGGGQRVPSRRTCARD